MNIFLFFVLFGSILSFDKDCLIDGTPVNCGIIQGRRTCICETACVEHFECGASDKCECEGGCWWPTLENVTSNNFACESCRGEGGECYESVCSSCGLSGEDGGCYSGPFCSKTCNGEGTCENGECDCSGCATGNLCEDTCSNHGICPDELCLCDACYSGGNCETECSGHGHCETDQYGSHCVCGACWEGDKCNDTNMFETCNSHGFCSENHTDCECDDCYGGATCKDECSNNGVCEDSKCLCKECCGGDLCELPCAGNGELVEGECICESNWTGHYCQFCSGCVAVQGFYSDSNCETYLGSDDYWVEGVCGIFGINSAKYFNISHCGWVRQEYMEEGCIIEMNKQDFEVGCHSLGVIFGNFFIQQEVPSAPKYEYYSDSDCLVPISGRAVKLDQCYSKTKYSCPENEFMLIERWYEESCDGLPYSEEELSLSCENSGGVYRKAHCPVE